MVASMRWVAAAACVLATAYSEEACGAVSEEELLQQEMHDVQLLQVQASVESSAAKHVAKDPAAATKDDPLAVDSDGGPERHPEALGALQADQSQLERSRLGAQKFLQALVEGHKSVAPREVAAALQSALSLKFNATTAEIAVLLRSFDKDADGQLAPGELRKLVHPELAEEEDEEAPLRAAHVPERAQELVQRSGTTSTWRLFTCCTDYSAYYYHGSGASPVYAFFKPKYDMHSSMTVKGCAVVCYLLPGTNSDPYIYSNAARNTADGYGMCRCLPSGAGSSWTWYASGSQNQIYWVR